MALEIPDNPKKITIEFQARATREQVFEILELVVPLQIQNRIMHGVHQVMLETRNDSELSEKAKNCLRQLDSKGNKITFQ